MIATAAEIRVMLGIDDTITDNELALLTMIHPLVEGAVKEHLGYDPEYRTHTGELYPRNVSLGNSFGGGIWDTNASGTKAVFEKSVGDLSGEILQLAHLPLRSVTSVYEDYDARHGTQDGAFGASTLLTVGDDYVPVWDGQDSSGNAVGFAGQIRRYASSWPSDPGTVKITYVAGYTAAELSGYDTAINASVIKSVVITEVGLQFRRLWQRRKSATLGFLPGILSSERLGDYSYSSTGSAAEQEMGLIVDLTSQSKSKLEKFRHYGLMLL